MASEPKLKLLFGGKAKQVAINGVIVSVAPNSFYPLPVDARVFEEDTHLVLTVDPVMRYTEEHPIRLLNNLAREKSKQPGSIVINENSWYAVVHDLDAEPTSRRSWVKNAYNEIFHLAEERHVHKIGIPLLGSVHGNMKPSESLDLMLEEIRSNRFRLLKNVMIIVSPSQFDATKSALFKTVQ
ncbi:MAG: hypothetical protein ACWGN1_05270 [Desulfobulbales bacterium]